MKQLIVITMMAFAILSLKAQNESSMPSISSISSMPSSASSASPASYFNHLDLSVSLGTSGVLMVRKPAPDLEAKGQG